MEQPNNHAIGICSYHQSHTWHIYNGSKKKVFVRLCILNDDLNPGNHTTRYNTNLKMFITLKWYRIIPNFIWIITPNSNHNDSGFPLAIISANHEIVSVVYLLFDNLSKIKDFRCHILRSWSDFDLNIRSSILMMKLFHQKEFHFLFRFSNL